MTIRSFIRVELGWPFFLSLCGFGLLFIAALVTAVIYLIF